MDITLCCPESPEPWLAALRVALPQARLRVWQHGDPCARYGLTWAPPQQFLDEQAGLRALFNLGAGVDGLLSRRLPPGLPIHRLEDAGMGVQMAEYVCHAVIRQFRDFSACEADARRACWRQPQSRSRAAFTVGLLGLGIMGRHVAQALRAFGFPLVGYARSAHTLEGVTCLHGADAWPRFLGASQVLVNLLPLTPETRDLLCHATLSQLPRGAHLINVGRGAHLVEADLLALLRSGHLASATLDVFRTEPLPADHPFWYEPRITITPHTAARTLVAESVEQIAARILALEAGQSVGGRVDGTRGY